MSDGNVSDTRSRPTGRRWIWVPAAAIPVAILLLIYEPLRYRLAHVVTDDAYVSGSLVAVAPSVPGRLIDLMVAEGDTVSEGQLIARLKDDVYRAVVAQTEATVAFAQSRLAESEIALERERRRAGPLVVRDEADLVAAKARASAAGAAVEQAEGELQRIRRLSESGLTSAAQLDVAQTLQRTRRAELDAAREEVNKAQAARQLTDSHLDAVRIQNQQVETARAELHLAESELESAAIRLASTHLYSPARGIVARVATHIGERVEEDQTVALIRSLDALWVVANVGETEIREIRQGQPVDIVVDAYPGLTFHGRVLTIGSVTSSQFALIPRESVGGNFVKVVQRVPVRISVTDPEGILKLGLSAVVAIGTRLPEHNRAP